MPLKYVYYIQKHEYETLEDCLRRYGRAVGLEDEIMARAHYYLSNGDNPIDAATKAVIDFNAADRVAIQ